MAAMAVSLSGLSSGAVLATVAGVLVAVLVMLTLVKPPGPRLAVPRLLWQINENGHQESTSEGGGADGYRF